MTFKEFQHERARLFNEMLKVEEERLAYVPELEKEMDRFDLMINPFKLFSMQVERLYEKVEV